MPDLSWERKLHGVVGGVDEVGRGCLAGPVFAAVAVITGELPPSLVQQIDDSKKLSPRKRQSILKALCQTGHVVFSLGQASVEEIDRLNILKATHLAMKRAVESLDVPVDQLLIDGNAKPPIDRPMTLLPGGDQKSLSIAAASIFAKEKRDLFMENLSHSWPDYDWGKNKGYGTKAHRLALKKLGRTPNHRVSFGFVRDCPLRREECY